MKGTQTRTKRRSATARFKISKFVVFFICGFAITLFGDDHDHGSMLLGGEPIKILTTNITRVLPTRPMMRMMAKEMGTT